MLSHEISYKGPEVSGLPELNERFPYLNLHPEEEQTSRELAQATIGIAALVEKLKQLERIPRGTDGRRENVAEHSYMVALNTLEAARLLKVELDTGKALAYALCHDILELETGDTNTFSLTAKELAEKEQREQAALDKLLEELPDEAAQYLEAYEEGSDLEATFVRAVDKLSPIAVNIASDSMNVILEDLGVYNPDTLATLHDTLNQRLFEKFGADFPLIVAAHGLQSIILEKRMRDNLGSILSAETQRNPTETERKFLIDLNTLPEDIDLLDPTIERQYIKQAYTSIEKDGSETRIRSTDGKVFEQTKKSAGTIQRKEEKTYPEIDAEIFDLWVERRKIGEVIHKTRYLIPLEQGVTAELDVYHGALEGLATAEVEFKGRDALMKAMSWTPPAWFSKDVTKDDRFKNKNLAMIDTVHELLSEEV